MPATNLMSVRFAIVCYRESGRHVVGSVSDQAGRLLSPDVTATISGD
jgi:hypothetical protein